MAETDITRMSSDYADNELELFRKTVSSACRVPFSGSKAVVWKDNLTRAFPPFR